MKTLQVPFWQPSREYAKLKIKIDNAIQGCLARGELCLGFGKEIKNLEKRFAKFIGTKHAIMCGSGTQALRLAYRNLGIKAGDEVITTSHTFIATIDQIVALGAKPILVDIGEDGLIDPTLIEQAITPQTKAIVPVHLEGKMCDMPRIMDIAQRYSLLVIEDAAQAIGASLNGKMAGSWGNAGCYSFFPAKILGSAGNAGMVVTNDDELAYKIGLSRCNYNIGKNKEIDKADFGDNLEPDAIQAAVLNVKLGGLKKRLAKRQQIAEQYDTAFAGLPITLPLKQEGRAYQDYIIRLPERKQEFIAFMKKSGIGILGYDLIPNHRYPTLQLNFDLPKTELYIQQQVRIPCNPDLKTREVEYIISKIKEFYA